MNFWINKLHLLWQWRNRTLNRQGCDRIKARKFERNFYKNDLTLKREIKSSKKPKFWSWKATILGTFYFWNFCDFGGIKNKIGEGILQKAIKKWCFSEMLKIVNVDDITDRIRDKDCFLRFSKVEPLQIIGLFSDIWYNLGRGKYERGPPRRVEAPEYILFNILFSLTKSHDMFLII